MCGILVSSKEIKKPISNLLTNRGPDHTSITSAENINFVHTLLSMTGEFTPQPIFKNNVYFLLNGEIYNFDQNKKYLSDIFYIVDLYFEYEEKFVNYLEGEFSVVIIDFNKNTSYFATDIFGIKPLYYSIEESQFGVCSYEEPLIELGFQNVKKVEPSSMIKFCIKTHKVQKTIKYFEFELRQFKNKYDDWVDSFISAVEKRFKKTDKEIILPLSSGFDSGAIACAFKLLNINSTIYSFSNYEHVKILNKRLKLLDGFKKIYSKAKLTEKERELAIELIKDKCSIFDYGPNLKKDDSVFDGINDPGAHGLAFLLNEVKNDNRKIKILASGHGADEIMSNIDSYHFGEPNPEKFPENLEDIFPWQNFYFGTQSSYLSKEESISGGFGIEGRYPFLDKNVVQEFLNLNNNLKNKQFKAPIVYMLKKYKFPYRKERTITGRSVSVKSGFNA